MLAIKIAGLGYYLPQQILTSAELEQALDIPAGWIEGAAGIRERRRVTNETTAQMGAFAGRMALSHAGFTVDDIDAIIQDIEPDRRGLPVLLRHYMNLGGRVLAFNEDARFASSVDGLLLVDLVNADVRRLDRFFGKGVAAKVAAAAQKPHLAA